MVGLVIIGLVMVYLVMVGLVTFFPGDGGVGDGRSGYFFPL